MEIRTQKESTNIKNTKSGLGSFLGQNKMIESAHPGLRNCDDIEELSFLVEVCRFRRFFM